MDCLRDEIKEEYEHIIFAEGLDDALMGVAFRFGIEPVACYDYEQPGRKPPTLVVGMNAL